MDFMIHVGNVLYMFSYLVRDILWLRVITVVAASCLLPYFYLRPEPIYAAIGWNLVFTALNVGWIGRLLWERRPVALQEEEQHLHQLAFPSVAPRELLRLLRVGSWERAEPRHCLVEKGRPLERMLVIYSGKAGVEVDGRQVAELGEGQCVGVMSFHTDAVPAVDVVALEPMRYVAWPKRALRDFLERNPPLRAAFQLTVGRELADRLRASWMPRREPYGASS